MKNFHLKIIKIKKTIIKIEEAVPFSVRSLERQRNIAASRGTEMSEPESERDSLLQAILELLVSAGYSRAQDSSVSAFDKVSGGLAWCIAAINSSVADLDDVMLGDQTQVLLYFISKLLHYNL